MATKLTTRDRSCLVKSVSFNLLNTLFSSADIDECADGTSLCDSKTTNCINLSPLYECKCKEGNLPITGDIYKCKGKVTSTGKLSFHRKSTRAIKNKYLLWSCRGKRKGSFAFWFPGQFKFFLAYLRIEWGNICNYDDFPLRFVSAKTCSALIESTGTTVSPSSCLQSEGSVVGDLCKFSCKEGFELPGNEDTLLCLSSGTWNASIISCKRK